MQQRTRQQLNIDQIDVSSPCSVPWEAMPGDDRTRFCGRCRQSVYNIAGLTRTEAQRLIANREGRLCARIRRRPDGTVVTADCWARLRAARRRGIMHALVVLLIVIVPELLTMRFGLGNAMRLAGLGPSRAPVAAPVLPPSPEFPEDVMVGGIGPDGAFPAKLRSDRQMEDVDLSLGRVRAR